MKVHSLAHTLNLLMLGVLISFPKAQNEPPFAERENPEKLNSSTLSIPIRKTADTITVTTLLNSLSARLPASRKSNLDSSSLKIGIWKNSLEAVGYIGFKDDPSLLMFWLNEHGQFKALRSVRIDHISLSLDEQAVVSGDIVIHDFVNGKEAKGKLDKGEVQGAAASLVGNARVALSPDSSYYQTPIIPDAPVHNCYRWFVQIGLFVGGDINESMKLIPGTNRCNITSPLGESYPVLWPGNPSCVQEKARNWLSGYKVIDKAELPPHLRAIPLGHFITGATFDEEAFLKSQR